MAIKIQTHCIIIGLALFWGAPPLAQNAPSTPPHVPLAKTIGEAGPVIVPSLIVINAGGASLQGGKLTLTGVAPYSIVFADRPVRAAGHSSCDTLRRERKSPHPAGNAKPPIIAWNCWRWSAGLRR